MNDPSMVPQTTTEMLNDKQFKDTDIMGEHEESTIMTLDEKKECTSATGEKYTVSKIQLNPKVDVPTVCCCCSSTAIPVAWSINFGV